MIPLAILLDDAKLKGKAAHWVDYILTHQREDGWLGPVRNPKAVGSQHEYDPWPVFVLFKALSQWADATGDPRVAPAMARFFKKLDELLDRGGRCSNGDARGWARSRAERALAL